MERSISGRDESKNVCESLRGCDRFRFIYQKACLSHIFQLMFEQLPIEEDNMEYVLLYLQLCWKQQDLETIHSCLAFLASCSASITNPDLQAVINYLSVALLRCFHHIVLLYASKSLH